MVIVSSKVIDNFLSEVELGRVETESSIYNIKMYINEIKNNDYDSLTPIMKIRDKEKFRLKIEEYIINLLNFQNKDLSIVNDDFIKDTLAHLFANATFTDLINPEFFIDRYIKFMNNPNLNIRTIDNLFDSSIKQNDLAYNSTLFGHVEKQSLFQETPYVFKTNISKNSDNGNLKYNLPDISFGIANGICYIYAIQKGKDKNSSDGESIKYAKRIKRLLYKLDDKVKENESPEYIDYINNKTENYPENITDVVPSAILALSLFLNILFENGIKRVKVVSFLPIRYNAKKVAFDYKIKFKAKKEALSINEINSLVKEYKMEHLRIQNNLTQKLLRNFNRLKFHFDNINFESFPFDYDECLNIRLDSFKKTNNSILEKIIEPNIVKLK